MSPAFRKHSMIRFSLIVLLLLALTACSNDNGPEGETTSASGASATSMPTNDRERFMLRDVDGAVRKWSEFSGKPIVINFWATWCGPCRMEIPTLKELYKEYHSQGVEIIGISMDQQQTVRNVVPFVNQMEIPWVVVYGDRGSATEFGLGGSIPMTVFYNAAGEETGRVTGAQPHDVFRKEFEKMIR